MNNRGSFFFKIIIIIRQYIKCLKINGEKEKNQYLYKRGKKKKKEKGETIQYNFKKKKIHYITYY